MAEPGTKEYRLEQYREWNRTAPKHGILFAGSSLMEMFPVEELAAGHGIAVLNRGVGGFVCDELLANLSTCITDLQPSVLFINIGTNDLSTRDPIPVVMGKYEEILRRVRASVPDVTIYMMAYYPVNYEAAAEELKPILRIRTNEKITAANAAVEALAARLGARYIDVTAPLKDGKGRLRAEYTLEGMHINEAGYRAVFPLILPLLRAHGRG